MRGTKHTRRLEKLGTVETMLKEIAEDLQAAAGPNGTPLTIQQKIGMTFAVTAVQQQLNSVRIWSQ